MTRTWRRGAAVVAAALGVLAVAACAPEKNIDVENVSDVDVTVLLGEESGVASATGGFSLLGVTECYGPPIVLEYQGGSTRRLDEEICPGDRLRITADDVVLTRESDRRAGES